MVLFSRGEATAVDFVWTQNYNPATHILLDCTHGRVKQPRYSVWSSTSVKPIVKTILSRHSQILLKEPMSIPLPVSLSCLGKASHS